MPLDTLVTGRIATLAGATGFGWVEAIGIRDGRVAFAGSEVDLETRADPFTRRIRLEPDQVAIPGLTDAHLHLAQAALATRQVDLTQVATLADGLERVREAHAALRDPDAWLEGHGWDSDRWGGWPTADDLERVAPGRRVAIWAHDHHALWASHAAIATAGFGADDPPGGVVRRRDDGTPEGVMHESATRLVTVHIPPATPDDLASAIETVGRELIALGVVACHDPGGVAPDPDLSYSYPVYARLSDAGRPPAPGPRLPARRRRGDRDRARLPQRRRPGRGSRWPRPRRLAEVLRRWVDGLADGGAARRHRAEPDRPLPADQRRGVWMTDRDGLMERVAARRGRRHRDADPRHRRRGGARRAGRPHRGAALPGRSCRASSTSRCSHPARPAPVRGGRHRRIRAARAPRVGRRPGAGRLWGARAEREAYTWRRIADTGAVMAFGTDAPVESFDPWPGLALAVRREDRRWPAGTPPFGPSEALTLDRALRGNCVDPGRLRARTRPRPPHGRPARRRRRHPRPPASMNPVDPPAARSRRRAPRWS